MVQVLHAVRVGPFHLWVLTVPVQVHSWPPAPSPPAGPLPSISRLVDRLGITLAGVKHRAPSPAPQAAEPQRSRAAAPQW